MSTDTEDKMTANAAQESLIKSICVFCGSSNGKRPIYGELAQQLGKLLVQHDIRLIYGGGGVGLMGVIAQAVVEAGGNVIGVIPDMLQSKEIPLEKYIGELYGELILVDSMHARKATMSRLCDAYITMPGGYGTLDELFEAITWSQLGIQNKTIGLLNVEGYFDPLLAWIDRSIADGFVQSTYRDLLVVDEDPAALLAKVLAHVPPPGVLPRESWRL